MMIKAQQNKQTSSFGLGATRALVAGALAQLNVQTSSKPSSSCSGSSSSTTHRRRQDHATYEVPAAASRLAHPTALDALFWAAPTLATPPTMRTVVKVTHAGWEDARPSPSPPIDRR